jgi:hypothetical protein
LNDTGLRIPNFEVLIEIVDRPVASEMPVEGRAVATDLLGNQWYHYVSAAARVARDGECPRTGIVASGGDTMILLAKNRLEQSPKVEKENKRQPTHDSAHKKQSPRYWQFRTIVC